MEKSMDLGFISAKASLLLVFLLMAMKTSSVISASEPEGGCTETLMAISPCLPYISSPPNNLSTSASTLCCEFFSAASDSGNATCLCYLLRQPFIFGFPLNTSRISSLFFVCPLGSDMNPGTISPLESLCGVSENSPPPIPSLVPSAVPSLVPSAVPSLAPAPVPSISASHVPSLPQEPARSSPTTMSPSEDTGKDSSTSEPVSSSSADSSTSEPVSSSGADSSTTEPVSSSCCSCCCSSYFLRGIIMLFSISLFACL